MPIKLLNSDWHRATACLILASYLPYLLPQFLATPPAGRESDFGLDCYAFPYSFSQRLCLCDSGLVHELVAFSQQGFDSGGYEVWVFVSDSNSMQRVKTV